MSMSKRTDQQNAIYPCRGVLPSHKRREVPSPAALWGHLEDLVPRGSSQSQKAADDMILRMWNVQKRHVPGDRVQVAGCQGLLGVGGGMGGTAGGYGVSFGGDEHVWEVDGGEDCTASRMY